MSQESDSIDDLRIQVSRLRFLVISILALGVLFLTMVNLAAVATVPRFERVFEEMLGSRDKLPHLTKLVITYSRLAGGLAPYALLLGISGTTTLGLLMGYRTRLMPILSILVMAALIIHWVVVSLAMFSPMLVIINGVGERT